MLISFSFLLHWLTNSLTQRPTVFLFCCFYFLMYMCTTDRPTDRSIDGLVSPVWIIYMCVWTNCRPASLPSLSLSHLFVIIFISLIYYEWLTSNLLVIKNTTYIHTHTAGLGLTVYDTIGSTTCTPVVISSSSSSSSYPIVYIDNDNDDQCRVESKSKFIRNSLH